MIASFYDKNFVGVDNNASLKIDKDGYKLIKRPVEFNELTCTCEAFTQDMQPTFLVVRDESGRYVYGSLAGVPVVNKENKTEITGTDLRSMLSSDVIVDMKYGRPQYTGRVDYSIAWLFARWDLQVNKGSFNCKLLRYDEDTDEYVVIFESGDTNPKNSGIWATTDYTMENWDTGIYNVLDEINKFLRFYNLYLETELDIANGEIKFIIGKMMINDVNVKLWEYGIKNYGKVVADVNETQGYYCVDEADVATWTRGNIWTLLSNGNIVSTPPDASTVQGRDIYPIKRKIFTSTENLADAEQQSIEALLDYKFNEDIELTADKIKPNFQTRFNVYIERGGGLYKSLPCGELQYDANNELVRFKIGYRYTGINIIWG